MCGRLRAAFRSLMGMWNSRHLGVAHATEGAISGGGTSIGTRSLLSQAKTLGGVGSIFLLLLFIPYVGPILAIVGLVLVLVAVMHVADYVGDRTIFKNAVYAVVLAIAGILVGAVVVFAAMFRMMGLGFLSGPDFNLASAQPGEFWGFIATMVVALVAMWAFYLVSAVYLKKSFDAISTRLNVRMFHTAALVYLIGAALAIILVGFIFVFVAQILFVVAFFSIPEELPRPRAVPG